MRKFRENIIKRVLNVKKSFYDRSWDPMTMLLLLMIFQLLIVLANLTDGQFMILPRWVF